MANFLPAYKELLKSEGTYSNHPNDRGGETWKGVARKIHPNWAGWKIVDRKRKESGFPKNLNSDVELEKLVQQYYKSQYWDVMNLDNCQSELIADELFDTAVNMGVGTAVKFLQRSLNALNKNQTLYPDIVADGVYGRLTESALKSFFSKVGRSRWKCLYLCLNSLQGARYISICENDKTQEVFMYGWFTRVFERNLDEV